MKIEIRTTLNVDAASVRRAMEREFGETYSTSRDVANALKGNIECLIDAHLDTLEIEKK